MAINKFHRSRLTFQPRSLILQFHQYIKTVFSENTWPIELKFHMETHKLRGVKFITNNNGHMTKMAAMPI